MLFQAHRRFLPAFDLDLNILLPDVECDTPFALIAALVNYSGYHGRNAFLKPQSHAAHPALVLMLR